MGMTRDLAEELATISDPDEVERRLLVFLTEFTSGYGNGDKERMRERDHASLMGYYWLPCFLCGRWRGGHEDRGCYSVMLAKGHGHCVCKDCRDDAQRINDRWPNGIEAPLEAPQ